MAFADGYYNTLKEMVYDESMNSKFDKKIVYSAMHGILAFEKELHAWNR